MTKVAGSLYFLCDIMKCRPMNGRVITEVSTAAIIRYTVCTLYKEGARGLCVIQQRFNEKTKSTYWSAIDPWLTDKIYLRRGFREYFDSHAGRRNQNGEYPTVTVRQIMWALRMKPIKRERWETVFDRSII